QHMIEIAKQRAAAGENDTLVDDIGGKFRRGVLKRDLYRLDDRPDRFGEAFGNLPLAANQFFGNAVHQVAAADLQRFPLPVLRRAGRADELLDPLRRAFADEQVMIAADIGDDRLIHLVAADADAFRIDNATEREDSNFRRAAADIDDHRARRLGYGETGADCSGHRLIDQDRLAGAGILGGFLDGFTLDRRGAGGNADDDQRPREAAAAVHLVNEVADHLLGDLEIGDDPVAERPDRFDIPGRAAEHHFRFIAHRKNLLLALAVEDRHD